MGSKDTGKAFPASASVGERPSGGPACYVTLASRDQKGFVKIWERKTIRVAFEQPQGESNFTLLYLLFALRKAKLPEGVTSLGWKNTRVCRLKTAHQAGTLYVTLKGRYIRTLQHPLPLGRWQGLCVVDDDRKVVLYTLQNMTHQVAAQESPSKSLIIQPGDAEFRVPS